MFSATNAVSVIQFAPPAGAAGAPPRAGAVPLPALTSISNDSSSALARLSSRELLARIAPGDRQLCQLMSRPRQESTIAEDNALAQSLIDSLEEPRRQLARRAADALRQWPDARGIPRFTLKREELQVRIQHVGLVPLLRQLRLGELNFAQRLCIATELRDCGAHTPTLRAWMGLEKADLEGVRATTLLNCMLTRKQGAALKFGLHHSPMLRELRAQTYRQVAMINARFGYSTTRPGWSYVTSKKPDSRVRHLKLLVRSNEARRRGVDVQLP